jgi:hypothetical protein
MIARERVDCNDTERIYKKKGRKLDQGTLGKLATYSMLKTTQICLLSTVQQQC